MYHEWDLGRTDRPHNAEMAEDSGRFVRITTRNILTDES